MAGLSSSEEDAGLVRMGNAQKLQNDSNSPLTCSNCKNFPPNPFGKYFTRDNKACAYCGIALENRQIAGNAARRIFSNAEASSHTALDAQVTILVSPDNVTQDSRQLDRAHVNSSNEPFENELQDGYRHITFFCQALHLPEDTLAFAKNLLRSLPKQKFICSNQEPLVPKKQQTIAACIIIASRHTYHERTLKEISNVTGISMSMIRKAKEAIVAFQREQTANSNEISAPSAIPISDSLKDTADNSLGALCRRSCDRLQLSSEVTRIASELAMRVSQIGALAGRSPTSVAAACIYLTRLLMGQPKTAQEIACVAGAAEQTIKTHYKQLLDCIGKRPLIKEEWLRAGGVITRLPVTYLP